MNATNASTNIQGIITMKSLMPRYIDATIRTMLKIIFKAIPAKLNIQSNIPLSRRTQIRIIRIKSNIAFVIVKNILKSR